MSRHQKSAIVSRLSALLVITIIVFSNLPAFGQQLTINKVSMVGNPPLKQFKSGVVAKDVQCRQGFQLVIKEENNLPACVKPTAAAKLIDHGWARLLNESDTTQVEPDVKTITLDDNGKSITLKVGESFLLKLGKNFNWSVNIDDQSVISRQMNMALIRGAQGIYNAHHAGTATLAAVGDPLCLDAEPPCKIHSILFTLKITVVEGSGDVSIGKFLRTKDNENCVNPPGGPMIC